MSGISISLKRLAKWVPYFIILFGLVLRLIVFIANHCLYLDELNVALNIHERTYGGLFTLLDYQQYAPPFFLSAVKLSTNIFGYSEFAFRLFPLICGLMSLWVFWQVLKEYVGDNAITWYSLAIVAVGFIYIRYSSELKQYSSDVLITLLLVLSAVRMDILKTTSVGFLLFWTALGVAAIWCSMPAVFVLAGVWAYYLYAVLRQRDYKKIFPLLLIAAAWFGAFGLYYIMLLKYQVRDPYLLRFHEGFFLNIPPHTHDQALRNVGLPAAVLRAAGGDFTLSIVFHLLTMFCGAAYLLYKQTAKSLLILVPLLCVTIACLLHKFTMIERVMLFSMPLLFVLVAVGIQLLFKIRFMPWRMVLVLVCVICIKNYAELGRLPGRMENEEITKELAFLKKNNIRGSDLYIHHLAEPGYRYYTTVHPHKDEWTSLKGATVLQEKDFDAVASHMPDTSALLYSYEEGYLYTMQQEAIKKYNHEIARLDVTGCKAIIYKRVDTLLHPKLP